MALIEHLNYRPCSHGARCESCRKMGVIILLPIKTGEPERDQRTKRMVSRVSSVLCWTCFLTAASRIHNLDDVGSRWL